MAFSVGQKVVCVDAGPFRGASVPTPLVLNRVYTVAGFDLFECLILAEQPGRNDAGWSADIGYAPDRFRPVVERKTDISIFTAMLTGKKQKVPA